MKCYWSQTRANGQPLQPGTVCYVTDLEDGTHPIYTYGRDVEEVTTKLAAQNANAQLALLRRSAPKPSPNSPAAPPAPRKTMTADEVMQATQDLQNPAKAASAAAKLVQDATGVDLKQIALDNFARMALAWQQQNPDFYPHPGNKRMLADQAKLHAGGELTRVTPEILTQSFHELRSQGYLIEELAAPSAPQPTTLTTFPDENPVQRIERPRGLRFGTGVPSTRLGAPQNGQTRTLKYTAEDIRRMPESKSKLLIERNDKDYNEACEFHFGRQATA